MNFKNFCKNFFFFKKKNLHLNFIRIKVSENIKNNFFNFIYFPKIKFFFIFFKIKKNRYPVNNFYKKNSKKFLLINYNLNFILKKNFFYKLLIKINFNLNFSYYLKSFLLMYKKTLGEGFFFIRGLILIFFLDASFTDDEPLWEPIE